MAHSQNVSPPKENKNLDDFEGTHVAESKFWRKIKQDPVVPIGLLRFLLFILYLIFD